MKVFRRIIGYFRPQFGRLLIANIFNLLASVFNLITIVLMMPLVDVVFNPPKVLSNAEPASVFEFGKYASQVLARLIAEYDRIDVLLWLTLAIVVAASLKNAFALLNQYFTAPVGQRVLHTLRCDVYEHLQNLSLSYFSEERKGKLISAVVNDVRIVNDSAIAVVDSFSRDPLQIILYTVFMFLQDWKLTLMLIVFLPIVGFIISRIADKLKKTSIDSQERMAGIISILDETLANVRIVKAFNMQEFEVRKFREESGRFASLSTSIQRKRSFASPIAEMTGVIAIAAIIWFIGRNVIGGTSSMGAGGLIMYIFLIQQLMQPLKLFGQVFNSIKEGIGAGERVFGLLDTQPRILNKPNAKTITGFKEAIRYENITFKYETGGVVLQDVSLTIRAGERVAIVGPSGGGKSTLVDLLPRFYDPLEGRITIDGVDLRDLSVESLRGLMGIVTQETILFNDSVRNNIAYGKSETSMESIIDAAKIANAHEFISKLPQGYETRIGDRGTKLSGGQRQRISLARAILKNPPVLIFDEATSALDTESEILVQEAVERTLAGRTSVVIAHRLSTIQHSDRIVVIEKGRIVEEGNHSSLIANGSGTYKRLYELQFQV